MPNKQLYVSLFTALSITSSINATEQPNASLDEIRADIVIRNGSVIDGTGKPKFNADVAISGDRIVYVGTHRHVIAEQIIDATGRVIAPGFIDSHSHADLALTLPNQKLNESAITQGITSIVVGADGEFSPAELLAMTAQFETQSVGTNVGFYVGHNGIRREIMGDDSQRKPSESEMMMMEQLVREGMEIGAVGFSTGLMYIPGRYSHTEEVTRLTRQVASFGGIYDSHVRDPINNLLASDREAIEIATHAGVAGKISHVKAVCLQNAGQSTEIIALVEKHRARNINIVTDQYPYDGAKTAYLSSLVQLTDEQRAQYSDVKDALGLPSLIEQLKIQSEQGISGQFSWLQTVGYSCIRITESLDFPGLEGQYLNQIARARNKENFAVLRELIISADHPIQVTLGGIDERDVQNLLVQPWNMIVTDGQYVNNASSNDNHPRSTGSFTKILRHYVRELNLLSIEQAIYKMTHQPAAFLGLKNRGIIRQGNFADLVIFAIDRITDRSNYKDPLAYSAGIEYLFVNGELVIEKSAITGRAPGKVLKRETKTPFNLPPQLE